MKNPISNETKKVLDVIAGILLRCFILTVLASLFVWLVFLGMGDFVYQVHTNFVDISRIDFDLFVLYSLAFIKALYVVFFLIPFIAIKHYLRGQSVEA